MGTDRLRLMVTQCATAGLFLVAFLLIDRVSKVQAWNTAVWMFLVFLMIDVDRDRLPYRWLTFLPQGILVLGLGYLLYHKAPTLWWTIAKWKSDSLPHLLNWNDLFRSIPFNDGAWFRESPLFTWFRTERVTEWMRWVYNYGFALSIWFAVIRSFFARDVRKMVQYTLSTHVLQFALIMPWYALVRLEEVWWILGHPDPFMRGAPYESLALYVQNCFPSMHTSVAFAVLLLALREKGAIFRWLMVAYMSAIIYSTVYLEIHWLLDIPPGMLLGWGSVRLADWALNRFWPQPSLGPDSGAALPAPAQ